MNSRSLLIKKTLLLISGVMLAITLGGCDLTGPAYQPLHMRGTTWIPSVRIDKNLMTRGGKTLEVGAGGEWASTKDAQLFSSPLPSGEVRIGNTTFPTGQPLNSDFNVRLYDASLRWRHFIANGPIGYEVAPGIAYTRLHFGASSGTLQGEESVSATGFEWTLGAIGRLRKTTLVEASITGFDTNPNLDSVSKYQVSVVQTLGHHIAVQGGYSMWKASAPSTTRSSVDTQASGPAIGMRFTF